MKMNNLLIGALALLLAALGAFAAHQESRVFTWPRLREEGKLVSGELLPVETEGWQSLRISNAGLAPTKIPVIVLDHLSPTANNFAIEGKIRYENVEGEAYLEMWTVLPDGRRFFTRTVADSGPLQRIAGTSGWRPFSLPFNLSGESPDRVILEVNAFMPGAGIIDIGPLRIVNLSPDLFRAHGRWWSGREAPWVGGMLGMAIFLLCVVQVFLSRRGARRSYMAVLLLMLVFGVICTVAGIVAVIDTQPFDVCWPLLFIGVVTVVGAPVANFMCRRRWRELELRKMQAMDTR